MSLSTCYLEYGRHVARLHRHRRRRRAYAPTSNTASHDNHEKINSWVSFCFPYMGCLWGSAWRPFGPLELRYKPLECPMVVETSLQVQHLVKELHQHNYIDDMINL